MIEELARLINPTTSEVPESALATAHRYTEMRDQFDRLERDLRQHALAVDRLLGREVSAPEARPYQETLYLQCARGERTAGRFRCVNRRGQRTWVTSSLRPFTMNGQSSAAAPTLSLRPGSFALDARASEIVSVEVDLSPCPDLVNGTLQTSIDLHMNDAVALKIWIEIDLHERC